MKENKESNQGFVVITAYCLRCKRRVPMNNIKVSKIKTKRGIRRIAKGTCPVCGAKLAKLLKTK